MTISFRSRGGSGTIYNSIVSDKHPAEKLLEWMEAENKEHGYIDFAIQFAMEIDKKTFDKYKEELS